MKTVKFENFMTKWLLAVIIILYYEIAKTGNIGFIKLTSMLIATLLVTIIYELLKHLIKR